MKKRIVPAIIAAFSLCSCRQSEPEAPPPAPPPPAPQCSTPLATKVAASFWEEDHHSCSEIEGIVKGFRIVEDEAAGWMTSGERALRDELESRFKVRVPMAIVPYGYMEHEKSLVVLGYKGTRVHLIKGMSDSGKQQIPDLSRSALAYYADKGGEGVWVEEQFMAWKEKPKGPLTCLPCKGWACGQEPRVCFSDIDSDGRPELLLAQAGPDFDELTILEPDGAGKLAELFYSENGGRPEWRRHGKEWVLVDDVVCESGGFYCKKDGEMIGDYNCSFPGVYRYSSKSGKFEHAPELGEVMTPVRDVQLPADCEEGDVEGTLLYTPKGEWIRAFKRRPKG